MQIQKDAVKGRILEAAEEAFFTQGYLKTSLRKIANVANITVGNIYRYFENKEALFWAVVEPAWEDINKIITSQYDMDEEWDIARFQELADNLTKIFLAKQMQFVILLTDEIDTPGVGVREDIEMLVLDRLTLDFIPRLPLEKQDPVIMEILAEAIVSSMFKLFREYDGDKDRLAERITRVIHIFLGSSKNWF